MYILGISEEHDAGAAILKDGKIIAAANEERLNRNKFSVGFPILSIKEVLKIAKISEEDVSAISISSYSHVHQPMNGNLKEWLKLRPFISYLLSNYYLRNFLINKISVSIISFLQKFFFNFLRKKRIKNKLRDLNFKCEIEFIDHHYSHACGAHFTSGWDDTVTITFDAAGDGYCSKVYLFRHGKEKLIHKEIFINSVAYYYLAVTLNAGFKAGREGKIMGLAAHGDFAKTLDIFNSRILFDKDNLSFKLKGNFFYNELKYIKKIFEKHELKDISAGVQKFTEKIILNYIQSIFIKYDLDKSRLCLSGGIFANVLLNQKISKLDLVKEIFIHPHMGDGGLALGGAFALANKKNIIFKKAPLKSNRLKNVFFGRNFGEKNILDSIESLGLKYKKYHNVEEVIAKKLYDNKVVARFNGPMEYGPRALGNRSILYQATDKSVNNWLNKRLKRTEYMPFAPLIMNDYIDQYFEVDEKIKYALEFMTITCSAKQIAKEKVPAIVHIDGTARPQIVNSNTNISCYNILKYYYNFSNIPILINTSFNIHEEPIVNTPKEALNTFLEGNLDILAINDFILSREENNL